MTAEAYQESLVNDVLAIGPIRPPPRGWGVMTFSDSRPKPIIA